MLYSRQGTTETIEEVEAEQDEVEASQDVEAQQDEDVSIQDSDDEEGSEAEVDMGPDGPEGSEEEAEDEAEEEEAEEAQDSKESEEAGLTPDTELPQSFAEDGDMEVPPSYSKAVSFERLSFGAQDNSCHMAVSPDDSRWEDRLGPSILPALTHELTASELLLNK